MTRSANTAPTTNSASTASAASTASTAPPPPSLPPGGFLADAVAGLTASPKHLPSKYFYDERGSALFERICELDEYYLTRTELAIMHQHAPAMAAALGPSVQLIEPGSGASIKGRLLLEHLDRPAAYVPIDISTEHLLRWADRLQRDLPGLHVHPLAADFTTPFDVPAAPGARRRVIFFPGSTIGNLHPGEAQNWLAQMASVAGSGGGLLIGVDLLKDVATLEAAYNDAAGVTRAFNLNLLARLRRELSINIPVEHFEHRAVFNASAGRVEMHLDCRQAHAFRAGDTTVRFDAGESIHTENSYKYDLDQFQLLAARAGWRRAACWLDDAALFSVQYFECDSPRR